METAMIKKDIILKEFSKGTFNKDDLYFNELLKMVVNEALRGHIIYEKNLQLTLQKAIQRLDEFISRQIIAIINNKDFQKVESTWLGLHYLVSHTETNESLRVKILDVQKSELQKDLLNAIDFDQSELFKKIYENEFGSAGGEPYGILVGDYFFNHSSVDIACLTAIAKISAAAFCPFISSIDTEFFNLQSWDNFKRIRDLSSYLKSSEYIKWNGLRALDESRFLCLTFPRALVRSPYDKDSMGCQSFNFSDVAKQENCWINAAYLLAERINNAQSQYGFATMIRGAEGGGKISNLPIHHCYDEQNNPILQYPTEVLISDRMEAELSQLGFLPLCYYKNSDYAVFFGGQSIQKATRYDSHEANANAMISTRLPYILASSRFAHYLKIMARDKIGAFLNVNECEAWLNRWILNYVNGNPGTQQELKAKYPLAEAKVVVEAIPGQPGTYNAIAWLKPWLQMEELTTSLRLVAKIPKKMNSFG